MIQSPSSLSVGQRVPHPHRGWGGCADELLHYTSRYHPYTEAFLRNLAQRRDFLMAGYQAEHLTNEQRALMLAMLCAPPTRTVARDIVRLVERARQGVDDTESRLCERYADAYEQVHRSGHPLLSSALSTHQLPAGLAPQDPLLALAARLGMPVTVDGWRVELPFEQFAHHLDSPLPQVRENLQQAVLWLHDAGFRLHNCPSLTHDRRPR